MKSTTWLLVGALFAGAAQAVPQYGPGPATYMRAAPEQQRAGNPAVAVRAGMDKLMGFLGGGEKPGAEALAQFLNNEIAPFFDFEHMARSAGGRLFERMNADEQNALVAEVKRSFLHKMAQKLAAYDRQQIRILAPRAGNDGRTARVSVAILNPGRYPTRLEFRMYRARQQWRVFDVSANGQSAIVHYRAQMMRQVQERQRRQMRRAAPPMRAGVPPSAYGRVPAR